MRTLVVGDIHGAYRAFMQVLDRAGYKSENDRLIVLGDVVDGWSDVAECINFLTVVPNLIFILGNHDQWAWDYLEYGIRPDTWLCNGGKVTINSFKSNQDKWDRYRKFFRKGRYYYIDEKNRVYVHGGFTCRAPVENQHKDLLIWDRYMIVEAMKSDKNITKYENVFLGHTSTEFEGQDTPIIANEVINLDTGAGWNGKLSVMDADTKEFWQSDLVSELYPEEKKFR